MMKRMMGSFGLYFEGLRPSKIPAWGGARGPSLVAEAATDEVVADM